MTILMLALAVLLPTLVGFLFMVFLSRSDVGQPFFEKLFFGYGIGMGIITSEIFILGLFGIKLSLLLVSSIQAAIIIFLCYLIYRSGMGLSSIKAGIHAGITEESSGEKRSKLKLPIILLLSGWILLKILFVISESANWPIAEWDSWTTWSSAAKFFFYEKGLALDSADENFFGRGYRESLLSYPLHVPLLQVWFSLCLGDIHEMYMKIWNSFYFVSTVGLLFFSLKREASAFIALLSAFFLSSVPLLTYHAITAYAELPLSYYSLAAAICFWRYINYSKDGRAGGASLLVLMGLCIVFGMWTKMEGLFFFVAFSIALSTFLLIKEKALIRFLVYLIPVVCLMGIWFIFLASQNIDVNYAKRVLLVTNFHFEVLPIFLQQFLFSANFNVILIFFTVMFFLGFKIISQSDLKYLYIVLFSVITMFLFLYISETPSFKFYKWVINLTSVNRNILTFIPLMYYVAALTAIKVYRVRSDT